MKPSTKKNWQGFLLLCAIVADLLRLYWQWRFPSGARAPQLAEPFSITALIISLSISAASFAVQRIFGPKPPKVTRGQQSGELNLQNADEGSPVAEIYGAAPNQSVRSATWTNLTNATVNASGNLENANGGTDNCFTNASGTGDAGAWTVQTIDSGDFSVTWTFRNNDGVSPSGRSFLGVTSGSFTLDYTAWNYAIHVSTEQNTINPYAANSIFIYEFGPPNKAVAQGVWTAEGGDTLRIECISGVVRYYHKSTLIYTGAVAPSYPLHVVASMACFDSTVEDLTVTTPQADTAGGMKTAGTVIWCKEPRKVVTTEKKGGKGAPKQTVETVTYYTDLAILFGRGRLRLKKLWANADLIVDLDADVANSTGLIDPGAVDTDPLDQTAPPHSGGIFGGLITQLYEQGAISATMGAGGASMRWYVGDYDQLPDALIEGDVGAGSAPAFRGYAYLVIENFDISKYGGVPTFLATLENMDVVTLADIANQFCERVNIEPQDKDFSVFDAQAVRGLIVQSPTAPRQTLEIAGSPYQAQFFETVDAQLTGVYLGGASVVTIDNDDLGAVEGNNVSGAQLMNKAEIGLADDVQIPRQLSVTAFDPFKGHETNTQSAFRMTGFSQGVENLNYMMALSPDETRQAAEYQLFKRHVERESAAVKLPWKYCYLNPTDIVEIVSGGITHRLRATSISGAVPGVLDFQYAADQQQAYSQSVGGTSGGGYVPPTVSAPVATFPFLIDTVTLQDADATTPGFYVAMAPVADGNWSGAGLYRDRGAGYELVEKFLAPATAGVASGALADADPAVWDETNTVTVDLYGTTNTLESAAEAQVLAGANAAMLGDEVIQYRTATQVGGYTNRWTLSGLLRARRGTDYATSTHVDGERFVLLDGAVTYVANDISDKDIARNYKGVTSGFSLDDTAPTSFTWAAGTSQPLSVVNVTGDRDVSNNLTVTWQRRTRTGAAAWEIGATAPIGEETEAYEVVIWDGASELRVISATSETASYSAAEQTADGLTPGDPVTVRVYQISALVGRGRVREVTV
jgi:hypothetical protein